MYLDILFYILNIFLLKILFKQNWGYTFALFFINIIALVALTIVSSVFVRFLVEYTTLFALSPLFLSRIFLLIFLYCFLFVEGKKFCKSNDFVTSINYLFASYVIFYLSKFAS